MSAKKLVLLGERKSGRKRVVIKASSKKDGVWEILQEQERHAALKKIDFAYHAILLPENLFFRREERYFISVFEYIEEEKPYLALPLEEQFFLALRAFKAQEGIHATAYSHMKAIRKIFQIADGREYLQSFRTFRENIAAAEPDNAKLAAALKQAEEFLAAHEIILDRYRDFFTHADFVPHNFRVAGQSLYLIDHSSFRFGNKYESWARFLNYMILYNLPLRKALIQYVRDNRTSEESLSLRLMRAYKLGFLLEYYAKAAAKTDGNAHILSLKRLDFWTHMLEITLDDGVISEEAVNEYKTARDPLRSEEEKRRQKELGQL